jgi:hypothetical protein
LGLANSRNLRLGAYWLGTVEKVAILVFLDVCEETLRRTGHVFRCVRNTDSPSALTAHTCNSFHYSSAYATRMNVRDVQPAV